MVIEGQEEKIYY